MLVPSLLRMMLNMKHMLMSLVSLGLQHMLKCFLAESQHGRKFVTGSKGYAGKDSY